MSAPPCSEDSQVPHDQPTGAGLLLAAVTLGALCPLLGSVTAEEPLLPQSQGTFPVLRQAGPSSLFQHV